MKSDIRTRAHACFCRCPSFDSTAVFPEDVLLDVPTIQQQFHWDCGLACSKMVLRYVRARVPGSRTHKCCLVVSV